MKPKELKYIYNLFHKKKQYSKEIFLRFLSLLKVTFTGTSVNDVRYVDFVIKNLHNGTLCFYHSIVDYFDSLQVALKITVQHLIQYVYDHFQVFFSNCVITII